MVHYKRHRLYSYNIEVPDIEVPDIEVPAKRDIGVPMTMLFLSTYKR